MFILQKVSNLLELVSHWQIFRLKSLVRGGVAFAFYSFVFLASGFQVLVFANLANHSLMIREDGVLIGSGSNEFGQLGLGGIVESYYPCLLYTSDAADE